MYIYQEANSRSVKSSTISYSNITKGSISANPLSIEYTGGTSYITATNGSQTWEEITTYSYTSRATSTAVTDSGSLSVTPIVNPSELVFEALDGGEEGPCLTSVATWSANGKTVTASTTVCQSSRAVTGTGITYSYGTVTAGTITNATIPASGSSTSYAATIRSGSQNYTAYTHNYWSDGTDEIVSQTTGTTTINPSPSSLSATASTRGTTTGTQKTITSTTVTWASKDGSTSKNKTATAYVYQEANALESHVASGSVAYTYGAVSVGNIYSPTAPASGTNGQSLFATAGNGSQPYTAVTTYKDTYTSASTAKTTSTSTGTASIIPVKSDGGSGIDYGRAVTSLGCTATTGVTVAHSRTVYYRSLDGTSSKDKSATMYIYQEANTYTTSSTTGVDYGSKTYATPTCGSITLSSTSVKASGGTVTASISNGSQTWSRTATPYTSYTYTHKSGCVSTGQTNGTAYSDTGSTSVSCSLNATSYKFNDRGCVSGAAITYTFTGTCTANGKTCTTTKSATQEANTYSDSTAYTFTDWVSYDITCGSITPSKTSVGAGENVTVTATISDGKVHFERTRKVKTTRTYTSGCKESWEDSATRQTREVAVSCSVSPASYSFSDRGCTTGATITKTFTGTCSGSGQSCTTTAKVTQAANAIVSYDTGYTYGNVTCGSVSCSSDIPASGGTVYPSATKGSQPYTATTYATYTSGSRCAYSTSTGSTSITATLSPTSCSGSNLSCTTKSRTAMCTVTATWSGNGSKKCTAQTTCYQQANAVVSTSSAITSYGAVTCGTITNATVSCTGGTKTATAGKGSQKNTITKYNHMTSGAKCVSGTTTRTDSISPNYSSTSATGSNLGTTETSKKTLASRTVTWSNGGKSCSGTMYVYQEANTYTTSTSRGTSQGTTTWGAVTCGTISNATVPASGGTKTATAGNGSQSWSRVDTPYTSYTYTFCTNQTSSKTVNGTSTTVTGTTTISPSVSSISATGSNRGTTTGSTTTLKSQAVTWSGNGGKSCSGTMYVYQQENSSYAEIRVTGVDTFMACQECISPSATATISYTSGKESSTSSGISFYCDGNLSKYGDRFCYDNERGSGQTDRITAKYTIGSKSYYGYSNIISLNDWSC